VTTTFDLGPVPTRVLVGPAQVERLVAAQFPQWADLPATRVEPGGWDNQTFRLGDELVVRLPSAPEYAVAVAKEHRWLPRLAPRLPLPVPELVGAGAAGEGYPHPWSVHRWIPGRTASRDNIADDRAFASDLAGFLAALRDVDPSDGPRPGLHSWYRGGSLRTYDGVVTDALAELGDSPLVSRIATTWAETLAVPWEGVDRWFHGDVAAGNLLVDGTGTLSAVLDFGTCGVGDPACDLASAWTLLDESGRALLRDRLAVTDPEWTRGRGWALWKAAATLRGAREDPPDPVAVAEQERVVEAVLRGV